MGCDETAALTGMKWLKKTSFPNILIIKIDYLIISLNRTTYKNLYVTVRQVLLNVTALVHFCSSTVKF